MVEDADGNMNPQAESTVDKMARGMPEDTGSYGDMHLHAERKMNEMAKEMFED